MSMQASAADHPDAEELMAYRDGEAPAHVVEHVDKCSTCAERAGGYAISQGELRRSLYRFDCPEAHALGEYELGVLDPVQRTLVAAHANECDDCRTELQTLRRFLAEPVQMPVPLLERARRMVATLFTPAPGLALGGLRGSAESTTRVYEVEDVTVTVGPGPGPGTLIGLVMVVDSPPDEVAGRGVRLISRDGGALTSTLDDVGNFEFSEVTPGQYALEVELPNSIVVIKELRVD
jgi:hypothetical protein